MAELAVAQEGAEKPSQEAKRRELTIDQTYTAELVFALIGPIGSPIDDVALTIRAILETTYHYDCEIIKLSRFIQEHKKNEGKPIIFENEYEKIDKLIEFGDEIRKTIRTSFLAELAIEHISQDRFHDLPPTEKERLKKNPDARIHYPSRRKCFIINSIKNRGELDILRSVYRDLFYFIGVFSPHAKKERNLMSRGMSQPQAVALIGKDAGDENAPGESWRQTVKKTFPLADFFVRVDQSSDEQLKNKVKRFLHLIFNTEIVSPTTSERAMYFAAAAAGNSACLSRQVGACLTDDKGDIVSIGWNDVPKFGGHLYQFDETDKTGENDNRCKNMGSKCHNSDEKEKLAREIANKIIADDLAVKENEEKLINAILNTRLNGLIEFSRAIHAEMLALILAGENSGARIKGGSLYCTTYPCHNCARHLIAAGIKNVYFIEPYPKSMAINLHADAITENEGDADKVKLLAFDGVSPNRYIEFFTYKQDNRKGDMLKKINPSVIPPKYEVTTEALEVLERIVVNKLRGV